MFLHTNLTEGIDNMSDSTYSMDGLTRRYGKPLRWLHGEIHTPPFTQSARLEAGLLLRRLQDGETLGLPASRPMTSVGARCHELRIRDATHNWRIMYRIDSDVILILEVFQKRTRQTPLSIIQVCKARLRSYDSP
jgi:phage-related protein